MLLEVSLILVRPLREMTRATQLTLLAALACHSGAQRSTSGRTAQVDSSGATLVEATGTDSAARFAWAFYDWYVRLGAPFDSIWGKRALFSPELFQALRADADAQAKDSEYIVGLDWDPFVNSQDPCPRYRIGPSAQHGTHSLVPVTGTCESDSQPDAVAELGRQGGGWVFVNFRHGADSGSLLSDLARLRRDRETRQAHD